MAALCRTQSGLRDRGRILDLSPEGCCIATDSLCLRVGARVMIRPEGMEGLTGVIRWILNDRAGVEFDRPLYGPVFEHLAMRHGEDTSVDFTLC